MTDNSKESIERELGVCPETNRVISLKIGRFGPFVQRAVREGSKMRPRNAALLKGMEPNDVNLEIALKLLSLPLTLGKHPDLNLDVIVHNGRYGPYIKCGSETRSLPADLSPLEITFEQCLLLLVQPKKARGGRSRKKPVKVLGQSPATEQNVTILVGKFGLYVTDGLTNVSLPDQMPAEELTFEHALELLEAKSQQ